MIRPAHWFLLGIIVFAAGVMRFADLGGRPAGIFRDEVEKGYNGWALATTGGALEFDPTLPTQIRWRRLPFMIDVGEAKTSAIYQYASVPFMWFGGLTVATTRMAAALAGTLAVLLIGLLFMRAWGPGAGLAAALWTALCPWHLIFSRWALQGAFIPPLTALVLAGLYGVEQRRRWGWPMAGAAMGWLFYAYSGAQPFVLAWGFFLLIIYRKELMRGGWPLALGAALFLVPVIPTIIITLQPGGSARWANVSIFNQPGATFSSAMAVFIQNYLSHFNPVALFWRGDPNPRHCIPGAGQMTPIDLVLLPIGLVWAIKTKRPLAWALLAAWVCGPIPAAITLGNMPHALRSFAMALPSAVWGGAGLWLAAKYVRARNPAMHLDKLVWVAAIAVGASLFALYWKSYIGDPRAQVAFEKGERDSWTQIARDYKPGQRVFVSIQIPYAQYYQLFFFKMDPREAEARGLGPDFFYFDIALDKQAQFMAQMRPGDWMVTPSAPWRPLPPTYQPLLTREESEMIRENWVMAWQKPM